MNYLKLIVWALVCMFLLSGTGEAQAARRRGGGFFRWSACSGGQCNATTGDCPGGVCPIPQATAKPAKPAEPEAPTAKPAEATGKAEPPAEPANIAAKVSPPPMPSKNEPALPAGN